MASKKNKSTTQTAAAQTVTPASTAAPASTDVAAASAGPKRAHIPATATLFDKLASGFMNSELGNSAANAMYDSLNFDNASVMPNQINAFGSGNEKGAWKYLGSLIGGAAKSHPGKALGLGASAIGNLAGLFNDDKIGIQALGTLGGGALSATLLRGNPYWQLMAPMIGGNVGMLFDSLRAQKEKQESEQQQQFRGY